jgi:regulatory protein
VERSRPPSKTDAAGLRARALRQLARREHTRAELERKLAPAAQTPEALAALLDELAQRGWLSERRALEQVVRARRGRFGSARIRRELERRGVPRELIAEATAALGPDDARAARALRRRKFGAPPRSAQDRA